MKNVENFVNIRSQLIESWYERARKCELKIKEVAQLASISRVQLSRILNGRVQNPKLSTIRKVEEVFKCRGV
jgi:transcriptional regulator with XRE-family HTH domain